MHPNLYVLLTLTALFFTLSPGLACETGNYVTREDIEEAVREPWHRPIPH